MKTPFVPLNESEQAVFTAFYQEYAPKLWGLIVEANLPVKKAEAILINTLVKAWPLLDGEPSPLARLLGLAYQQGLPIDGLRAHALTPHFLDPPQGDVE